MIDSIRRELTTIMSRKALREWKINKIDTIKDVPSTTPIIFLYSHKSPRDGESWAQESKTISRAVRESGDNSRIVEHVVRPVSIPAMRIRQTLSPIHEVILTSIEEKSLRRRIKHNKRILLRVGKRASISSKPYSISIAPDGGQTEIDYPNSIDPQKIKTGCIDMLIEGFRHAGLTDLAIIPIRFDYQTKTANFGKNIYPAYSNTPKAERRWFIASKINEL